MPIRDSKTGEIKRPYTIPELEEAAKEMRVWNMISLIAAGSGHTGGTMSIMDIAAALYLQHLNHDPSNPQWEDRDRVFWSVGHKAPAIYCALGQAGYFDDFPVKFNADALPQFADVRGIQQVVLLRKLGSPFEGHPHWPKLPGLEFSSGSLGQGLGVACGSALDAKLRGKDYRCYCIMGDGEQDEGSLWESAMFASHYKLDNLVGILDRNMLQIDGSTADVMSIEPIADKYRAFGWEVRELDGHDMGAILEALDWADSVAGKPALLLAHTVKGKCISYAENVVGYHGVPPKDGRTGAESLEAAILCLNAGEQFPEERVDEILKFAEDYQKAADQYVEGLMPSFGKGYWWNAGDDMQVEMDATRNGFGVAISELGGDERTIAHGADITGSIRMDWFYKPDQKNEDCERKQRFISCGIAEANMSLVAAGFAKEGRIPFIGSYGVFATGRNWDMLRTTIAYGGFPVKIANAHGGVSVGPDGATHQALEEISLITCIPGFVMEVPCDSHETAKATRSIAYNGAPSVVRYAREATPVVTTEDTPFEAGVANVSRFRGVAARFVDAFETVLASDYQSEGEDLAIIACGPMVPEAMRAAWILKQELGIETRVVNCHTVKPIDKDAIIAAGRDTKAIVTAEEHQVGGFGNIVAGVLCQACLDKPIKLDMIGVQDRFGQSGQPWELTKVFGLTGEHIADAARKLLG